MSIEEKEQSFRDAIASVHEKHKDYFEKREDSVYDHLLAYHEGTKFGSMHMLNWKEDTDLDLEIRQEVFSHFKEIFGSKT